MYDNKYGKIRYGVIATIIICLLIIGALGLGFVKTQFGSLSNDLGFLNSQMEMQIKDSLTSSGGIEMQPFVPPNGEPYDTTFFENYGVNPFISTEDEHFSTFGMDVDTASYTVARKWINDGNLPDKDSVRVEEYINYFDQDYIDTNEDFTIILEGAESEFGKPNYHLLKIGIKAKDVSYADRKEANMIFLVDVSGSMNREDRIELVKNSLTKLADKLKPGDKVGLAVYAGGGGKILDLTNDKNKIINALSELKAGGSTNLDQGLEIAYGMARKGFEEGKINRIIICSDGVANVGTTGSEELLKKIKKDADKGITLTTLGFGMGNYNDVLMEQLANHGDGNYYYIDSEQEADRLFENGATSMLQIVASDAKIQVEFNTESVDRFRLIGYENRRLETEDFRNDSVDAGEVGAGQTVTALYEIRIKDDVLIYKNLADVRIRYLNIDTKEIIEKEESVSITQVKKSFSQASPRFRFTAGVAEFAEILKESYWAKDSKFENVLEVVESAIKDINADEKDEEFVDLIKKTIKIK